MAALRTRLRFVYRSWAIYFLVKLVCNPSFLGQALEILMNSRICTIWFAPQMIGGEQLEVPQHRSQIGRPGNALPAKCLLYPALVFFMKAETMLRRLLPLNALKAFEAVG